MELLITSEFPFLLIVLPYIVPFQFEENLFAGESVQITCYVSKGDTPLKISWMFHGEDLSTHMGMTTSRIGERTSLLAIDSLMSAHSGNYTCKAENRAGTVDFTAPMIVSG